MSRTGSNPADINRFGSHTVKVNKFFNSFKVAALVAYRGVVKKHLGHLMYLGISGLKNWF